MRLGTASLQVGDGSMEWDQIRELSLQTKREKEISMQVAEVKEFGALWTTLPLSHPNFGQESARKPGIEFAELINQRLATVWHKDIYIYVPGYRTYFETAVMVSSEFWHYLGYDGVFIAYSWPSTPSLLAYMSDIETAVYATRNFRLLLTYLAENTDVERIHVIGYSAGTRIVSDALKDLRLIHYDDNEETLRRKLRIGHIFLVGPDIDLEIFKAHARERMQEVPERLYVYVSDQDVALAWSQRILGRARLGTPNDLTPSDLEYLRRNDDITLINVVDAESAATGNGHGYFRKSPWVSSDILLTLKFGLAPLQRGLVREENDPLWRFPDNYPEVLKEISTFHYPVEEMSFIWK
jgi:esterase/lipase superfamily enzyme